MDLIGVIKIVNRLSPIILELDELKRQTNDRFQIVFETLDHLLVVEERPKRKIGFTAKEKRAAYCVKQTR